MFISVGFFLVTSVSVRALPPDRLWSEGERSEPSGTACQGAGGYFRYLTAATIKSCLPVPLLLSLLRQGIESGAAQVAPVACVRSCYPRTAFGLSVTQRDPRAPCALNSNRCLNRGLGHEFACIRRSRNTFAGHETYPSP